MTDPQCTPIQNSTQEKLCKTCGRTLPLSEFYKEQRRKDGLKPNCKQCHNGWVKKWSSENPEKVAAIEARSRLRNRERLRSRSLAYGANNRERLRIKGRELHKTLKDEAYVAYGGYSCVCCGETEPMFLCLDHIANDGYQHRKEVGNPGNLYRWLKNHNYPANLFQVLCFNCNQGKRLNGGVCPHQSRGV